MAVTPPPFLIVNFTQVIYPIFFQTDRRKNHGDSIQTAHLAWLGGSPGMLALMGHVSSWLWITRQMPIQLGASGPRPTAMSNIRKCSLKGPCHLACTQITPSPALIGDKVIWGQTHLCKQPAVLWTTCGTLWGWGGWTARSNPPFLTTLGSWLPVTIQFY